MLLVGVVLCSCGSDDPEPDQSNSSSSTEPKVSTTSFEFTGDGGSKTLSIQSSEAPSFTVNADWVHVKTTDVSSSGVRAYTVTADANPTTEARITSIVVSFTSVAPKTISVKQAAGNGSQGTDPDTPTYTYVKQYPELNMTDGPVAAMGMGWNLGNQMDAYNNGVANETCWGNGAATQETFTKLRAAGFSSVRIPVTWLGHIGSASSYTIDDAWMNRVAELVGYAHNAGLKVIINIHHDGADSAYWLNIEKAATDAATNTQIKEELSAIWKQIATKFKNEGDYLIFEAMNEIHDGGWGWGDNRSDGGKQYAVLNEWNQVFVDAVRSVGGQNSTRYLGIPGYVTNPDLTVSYLQLPTDTATGRLMVAVHYYDPNEFAINATYSQWGHTAQSGKAATYGNETDVQKTFKSLQTTFVNKGVPVYLGEMGCVRRSDSQAESFRKYYLEYVCKAAKDYGLAPFFWDNGATGTGKECFGLLNHATGEFLNNGKDIIEVMLRGMYNDDASYSLSTVYNNAPKP
jgi:endoglucanase